MNSPTDKMDESGISLGFDLDPTLFDITSLINSDLLQMSPTDMETLNFYEIQSKPVPLSESPSFKTEVVKSRTQMKQQLQKDQLQKEKERKRAEEERKELETSRSSHTDVEDPPIDLNIVPSHVLHVKTGLANPTKYHIMKKQKNQVLQFLSTSQKDEAVFEMKKGEARSAPLFPPKFQSSTRVSSSFTIPQPSRSPGMLSIASGGTSDAEDVLNGILSYEEGSVASEIDSQPRSRYGSQASLDTSYSATKHELYSPYDDSKDRVKKDTHNMIERKRRYNINDRIKELGDLLPQKNDPYYDVVRDCRANKGTILKSSVDFIKVLKVDNNKLKQIEFDNRQLQSENRKLMLRIQQLEIHAQAKGVNLPVRTWKPVEPETIINQYIRPGPKPRGQMPDVITEAACVYEESMDDVVLPDPIFGSTSLPVFQQNKMDTD